MTKLKVVAGVAILIIIMRQFILYDVPELFPIGQELGELLFNLSIGYLVTFWFYFLTVYRPEQEHKKRANAYAKEFVKKIVQAYESLIEDLIESQSSLVSTLQLNIDSKEALIAILKITDSTKLSPRMNNMFVPMTWADLFLNQRNQIERFLREITIVYGHLEPHQNEVITKMLSHHLLEHIRNIPLSTIQNLDFLAEGMWEFGTLVKELKKEFDEELEPIAS
ncbi:hypothetical protein [Psychrobacillus sp. MER TA 171]|uniref:hypothetical protein n=1 Tax=Psychrobacillus sp. MER TA 171 TaxID=2939577 RepID=UPI002041836D|nr:hypothetical protein [Psychrobacillus sp. MER TA 171]MCM3359813.1 hypothetical protein [Psychrobacillus sp. MER TA 171]